MAGGGTAGLVNVSVSYVAAAEVEKLTLTGTSAINEKFLPRHLAPSILSVVQSVAWRGRGTEGGMTEKWGGRYLVQRFAAHLAHLLNTGDEFIEINPLALYRTLIRTLAGPPDATGCRYAARRSACRSLQAHRGERL